ncbi:MAG: hypothetical protein V3V04_05215 [Rhizobiaceae bacterium]
MKRHFPYHKIIAITLTGMVLGGCVTNTPDVLFSTPLGEASKTGSFPVIGRLPEGQTSQLTPTEKSATKTELNRDSQKGAAQAAKDSQSEYNREVAAMKSLATQQRKKRLADIASRKF